MALTSPDAIRSPNDGDQYALVQDLGVLADSTQVALTRRGNMYVGTSAQRIAFTTAPDGAHWQDTNGTLREYVRQSGAWRGVSPLSGSTTLSTSDGSAVTQSITFPAGYFSAAPSVMVSLSGGQNASVTINYGPSAISATGFTINMARSTNTNTSLYWQATPSRGS